MPGPLALLALGSQLLVEHDDDAPGRQVVTTALLHALLVVLARLADAAGEQVVHEAGLRFLPLSKQSEFAIDPRVR